MRISKKQREIIYNKTKGYCHICGDELSKENWVSDHVVPKARGGEDSIENYLPACKECNRLRWFYKPTEIKQILELGVYTRKEMLNHSKIGKLIEDFYNKKIKAKGKRNSK